MLPLDLLERLGGLLEVALRHEVLTLRVEFLGGQVGRRASASSPEQPASRAATITSAKQARRGNKWLAMTLGRIGMTLL